MLHGLAESSDAGRSPVPLFSRENRVQMISPFIKWQYYLSRSDLATDPRQSAEKNDQPFFFVLTFYLAINGR